jgi:hypothetical protein
MIDFVRWAFSLPCHIWMPVYFLIGVLIGINYRFFVARHVWKKHQQEDRPERGNCWCVDSTHHVFISAGDWAAFATWSAPITWPIHLPIALVILVFLTYAKFLRFFHLLGQKGAQRTFAHFKDEAELRKELERITKFYDEEKRERQRYAGLRDDCEKTIGALRNEIFQLKAKKPDDVRFEELMKKTDETIKELDKHAPGAVQCPKCEVWLDDPDRPQHYCKGD